MIAENECPACGCDPCMCTRPVLRDTAVTSNLHASDGSSADYYKLPAGCTELQHLISYKNMNAQLGEIQRAVYRYGQVAHSERERDLKKIIFYAQAELERLAKYG